MKHENHTREMNMRINPQLVPGFIALEFGINLPNTRSSYVYMKSLLIKRSNGVFSARFAHVSLVMLELSATQIR